MANNKRSLYSVSINGQGFVLRGAPNSPARSMVEASLRGLEPSEGSIDLDYKDSSSFLPWSQTDWSGGFQFEHWSDNAGFLSGSGLEYIEKYGELTLLNDKSSSDLKSFGTGFSFGASKEFNDALIIGISKASGASELWSVNNTNDTFSEVIHGGWANIDGVNDMEQLEGLLYIGLDVSSGSPLKSYNGSSIQDVTLLHDLSGSLKVRMVVRIESRLYVAGNAGTDAANGDALMYSDDRGSTWTALITKTGLNRQITQGVDSFGSLYFIIEDGFSTELWSVNNTIVTQIYRWNNLTSPKIGAWNGNVYIQGLAGNGKLRYYKYDGASLRVIFEEKADSLTMTSSDMIQWKENLYSFGLVFDGVIAFPSYAFQTSSNNQLPFAVWGTSSSQVPYFVGLDGSSNLVVNKLDTAAYQTSGKALMGRFNANKVAVDKLWHSVTILFEKLVSSQTIQVEYSTDDGAAFTSIGTITYASSGDGANTEETLFFASNTKSRKIQLRITLGSGGTNTPKVQAFTTRYLVLGDNRFAWSLELMAYDPLMLLDGKTKETKNADELKSILHFAKWTKQVVTYQDIDYQQTAINDGSGLTSIATTVTVDGTDGFPEQGRLKIGQEEILYTGKTATTFTGLTRGSRGTQATTHSNNDVISTKYDVLLTTVSEITTPQGQADVKEAILRVNLLEI